MRDYVRITDTDLKENCENISAVLRHLCEDSEKKKELLKIVSGLPENEIKDIGFITTQLDDVIFARFSRPKLTTMRYPISMMATKATQMALQLATGEAPETTAQVFRPVLVRRQSSAAAPQETR